MGRKSKVILYRRVRVTKYKPKLTLLKKPCERSDPAQQSTEFLNSRAIIANKMYNCIPQVLSCLAFGDLGKAWADYY